MTREEKFNLLNELLEYEEKNDIGLLTRAERREFQQWILEQQEPFINKPCVSSGVCEHDKNKVLDKIRAEIEQQERWLMDAGYNAYNVDIAFSSIKLVIDNYKAESEKT